MKILRKMTKPLKMSLVISKVKIHKVQNQIVYEALLIHLIDLNFLANQHQIEEDGVIHFLKV